MNNNFFNQISNTKKPYIIAEIGSNHNGNISLGKKLINLAKKSGADCVKFQSWTPDTLYSMETVSDKKFTNEIIKYQTTKEQLNIFYKHSKKIGISFSSSVFSKSEVDFIVKNTNPPFLKIASMDINNHELLSYASKTNLPIVISTGLSNLSEIDKAIRVIESVKNYKIIIMHCISNYPPKDDELNLRNIETLSRIYPYPVGFSDHSIGTTAPLVAITLGAKIIEKHFTVDKNLKGWDHSISADANELKFISNEGSRIFHFLGSKFIKRVESNSKLGSFRRSCVAKENLNEGDVINSKNVIFKRPGTGIPPDKFDTIKGKIVKNPINKGTLINPKDLN